MIHCEGITDLHRLWLCAHTQTRAHTHALRVFACLHARVNPSEGGGSSLQLSVKQSFTSDRLTAGSLPEQTGGCAELSGIETDRSAGGDGTPPPPGMFPSDAKNETSLTNDGIPVKPVSLDFRTRSVNVGFIGEAEQ